MVEVAAELQPAREHLVNASYSEVGWLAFTNASAPMVRVGVTTEVADLVLVLAEPMLLARTTAKYGKNTAPAMQTHIGQPCKTTDKMTQTNRMVMASE